MALTTDTNASFQGSMMDMVGYQMSKLAADKCYKATGLTANDVQVVELHDCFSANEVRNSESTRCEIIWDRFARSSGSGYLLTLDDFLLLFT